MWYCCPKYWSGYITLIGWLLFIICNYVHFVNLLETVKVSCGIMIKYDIDFCKRNVVNFND